MFPERNDALWEELEELRQERLQERAEAEYLEGDYKYETEREDRDLIAYRN